MTYIELHAASAFSFLRGASLPETLVERAATLGYPALALLDADGVYGAPRFYRAAKQAGLKAIVGAELTIERAATPMPLPAAGRRSRSAANHQSPAPVTTHQWPLPVLVASAEGYRNLCRLVTRMKMRAPKGEGALALDELDGFTGGLVALAGRPALDAEHYGVGGLLDRLVGLFGREHVYVELQRHRLRDEESDNAALVSMAEAFRVPVMAANGVRFAEPGDRPLFDVLTCVRHRTTLDAAGRRLARNAERYLKSPAAMAQLFADRPDALAGTAALAERLEYTMADLGYQFPVYPVPSGETQISFLRHITDAGARNRYRPYHEKARAQVQRELDLIEKLDLAGYFLIVWDIVNYARQQDILVQGRGSAANSAVCYSLGITAVDPIAMDLLFERFLSEERGEWPDIDLDFPSGDRRERVIQHVYEKYGRLGAAMTANVITYRTRSAAREVGKALSLGDGDIDALAKVMHNFEFVDPNETFARNLAAAGLSLDMPRMRTFAELWLRIQDLPRHLGQHSGGMVVCQGSLDSVVPLEPASMPGRVVVQWDKDDCADMGIVKVDLLGLGMMAVLQDAIELVNAGIRDPGIGDRGLGTGNPEPRVPLPPSRSALWRAGKADTTGRDPQTERTRPSLPEPPSAIAPARSSVYTRQAPDPRPGSPIPGPGSPIPDPRSPIPDPFTDRPCAPAAERSGCLRPAAESRHDRGLPGRVARADGDAAAAEAGLLLRPRRAGRHHPSWPHRRRHGASVPEPPRRQGAGRAAPSLARAGARAHAWRAAVPGAAAAHGDGCRGVHRRSGRGAAPRDGLQALGEADEADRGTAARGHGAQRHHRRDRRADHQFHHVVRAVRLSGVARRQLRAARIRQRVSEGEVPGGVLHGAAQQPADGLLSSRVARQGRAAPGRAFPSNRRAAVRLAVPRRGGRRHPHRPHVRERIAKGRRAGHGSIRPDEDDGAAAALREVRL